MRAIGGLTILVVFLGGAYYLLMFGGTNHSIRGAIVVILCMAFVVGVFVVFDHEYFSEEAHERHLRKELMRHQRELLKLSQRSISGEVKDSSTALKQASKDIQAETEKLLKELQARRQKDG